MAKNFGNAINTKIIDEVAKESDKKAQVTVLKMISNDCLVDYPKNHENITDTADLENAISELGFIDPIEVTHFGQKDKIYMIVSGHRRRQAGVKCGMDIFPCIVKTFNNEIDVYNYVLLSNSQRDSSKDPLLFCNRYKMHEEYLKSAGFKGNIREEIAKRLGISIAQANRYNTMNKVIVPVCEMVRNDTVGMSSVLPLARHTPDEQLEIYYILQEALKDNVELTREIVKKIVNGYREGKKTWIEIIKKEFDNEKQPNPVGHEFVNNKSKEFKLENNDNISSVYNEDKQVKRTKNIQKKFHILNKCLSDTHFENKEEAEKTLNNIADTFNAIIDELYTIAQEYNISEFFNIVLEDIKAKIGEY